MHAPAIRRPSLRPGKRVRAPAAPASAISFTLATDTGLLTAATAAGWAAWGIDPAGTPPPIALDCAMPALAELRALRDLGTAGDERVLAFWTPRGVVHWRCRLETGRPPRAGVITVRVLGEAEAMRAATSQEVALTAWLAHELRTPLGAVIASSEILKSAHFGALGDARYQSYADAIYDSARHALGLVDGILRGDPRRSGVPALAFADLDPVAVVESCLQVARPLADRAGLVLRGAYSPGVPHIVADEMSLRQMLLNLAGNAIKFARPGDRVTIGIAHVPGGPLTISVTDTGPGMDAGRPRAGSGTGLGLGLPLSKALAEANGAELTIESAPGVGTCVTIAFGKDRLVPV